MRTAAIALLLSTLLPLPTALGQPGTPGGPGAIAALTTTVDLERTLLDEDLEEYRRQSALRDENGARLERLYLSLEGILQGEEPEVLPRLDALLEQIEQEEAQRTELRQRRRALVNRIRERLRRIAVAEERLAELRARQPADRGLLTGTWDITLLPLDQRGTCALQQSGTIVTGTYRLSGGLSGSFQGTLVDRKVHLVRIDSRLGRIMELEGFLSSDGQRIRGAWLNYELAGSEGATGQWSATRRVSRQQP